MFRDHIRDECPDLDADCIPAAHTRRITQEQLDSDPCFAPLHQVIQEGSLCLCVGCLALDMPKRTAANIKVLRPGSNVQVNSELGRIVIRPMHREHIFETALLQTEAFLVDRNPPTFPWMM